jgi:hypothetical protein
MLAIAHDPSIRRARIGWTVSGSPSLNLVCVGDQHGLNIGSGWMVALGAASTRSCAVSSVRRALIAVVFSVSSASPLGNTSRMASTATFAVPPGRRPLQQWQ